jgi:NADH pyrophosphatase NudC (nudix superfamily)
MHFCPQCGRPLALEDLGGRPRPSYEHGGVEADEVLDDAVVREMLEETGLEARGVGLVRRPSCSLEW